MCKTANIHHRCNCSNNYYKNLRKSTARKSSSVCVICKLAEKTAHSEKTTRFIIKNLIYTIGTIALEYFALSCLLFFLIIVNAKFGKKKEGRKNKRFLFKTAFHEIKIELHYKFYNYVTLPASVDS